MHCRNVSLLNTVNLTLKLITLLLIKSVNKKKNKKINGPRATIIVFFTNHFLTQTFNIINIVYIIHNNKTNNTYVI